MIESNSEVIASNHGGSIFDHSHLYGDAPANVKVVKYRKSYIFEVPVSELKEMFDSIVEGLCSGEVVWDEAFRTKVDDIATWQMARLGLPVKSKWPVQKGIILAGKCGVGKSLLMRALREWQIEINRLFVVPNDLMLGSKMMRETQISQYLTRGKTIDDLLYGVNGLFVDDFGRVEKVKYFGTDIYPTAEIIEEYYERWEVGAYQGKRENFTIYGTTNLLPDGDERKDQFLQYLGAKAYDRLRQMAIIVNCNNMEGHRV